MHRTYILTKRNRKKTNKQRNEMTTDRAAACAHRLVMELKTRRPEGSEQRGEHPHPPLFLVASSRGSVAI